MTHRSRKPPPTPSLRGEKVFCTWLSSKGGPATHPPELHPRLPNRLLWTTVSSANDVSRSLANRKVSFLLISGEYHGQAHATWSPDRFQSRSRTKRISYPKQLFAACRTGQYIKFLAEQGENHYHTSSPWLKALRISSCSSSARAFLTLGGFIDSHLAAICASVGSSPNESRSAIRARERFPCSVYPKNFSHIVFVYAVKMLTAMGFEPGMRLWYLTG